MPVLRWAVGLAALGAVAGCAGGSLRRIDDAALADVSLEEKGAMLAADAERTRAREGEHAALAAVALAKRDVAVADAERVQRSAEVRKARAQLDLANSRRDRAQMANAQDTLALEHEGLRVAEARLAALRERQALAEQNVAVARAHERWTDARYELERARLAERKGRAPGRDFTVRTYQEQVDRTHRDLLDARLDATHHQEAADKAEHVYQEREQAYRQRANQKR